MIYLTPYNNKPAVGVGIDWASPLANQLVFLALPGGDNRFDYVNGTDITLFTNTNMAGITMIGPALNATLSGGGGVYTRPTGSSGPMDKLNSGTAITLAIWGKLSAFQDFNNFFSIGSSYNDFNGSNFTFGENAGGKTGTFKFVDTGSTNQVTTSSAAGFWLADNLLHYYVVTRAGTAVKFYRDGVQFGTTQTTSANAAGSSLSNLSVVLLNNGSLTANTGSVGSVPLASVWARDLSIAEVQQLYAQPYALLDRPAFRIAVWKAAGGTAWTQTLLATQSSSSSLVKVTAKVLTRTQPASPSLLKAVAKPISASQTNSASATRLFGRTVTATQTSAATITKAVAKVPVAVQATSASLTKSVAKILIATRTATPSITKAVAKVISTSSVLSAVASGAKSTGSVAYTLTLTATTTAASAVTKSLARTLSATQANAATATRLFARTLSSGVGQVATARKAASKNHSVAVTTLPTITKSVTKSAFTAVVTLVPSATRRFGRTLSATTGVSAVLTYIKSTFVNILSGRPIGRTSMPKTYVGTLSFPKTYVGRVSFPRTYTGKLF